MSNEIGPHLLGRLPRVPDERDFRLENFLGIGREDAATVDAEELVNEALLEMKMTTVGYKQWAATKYADVTATHWWKAQNFLAQVAPLPVPPSPSPTGDVVWPDPDVTLNQLKQGTCVGHGCAQWGNTDPVEDHFDHEDALDLYFDATVLDGSPDDPRKIGGGQQGATVKSGVIALLQRGRLTTYAVTTDLYTMREWIRSTGPVIMGSNWLHNMFRPNTDGYVTFSGAYEGGHCYLGMGDLASEGAIEFLNSWGPDWGLEGRFKMKYSDVASLLGQDGEAWTAPEIAL